MNITKVSIRHVDMNKVRAIASITIDDDFVVHDLRVVEGERGLFVAMPSRRITDRCPMCRNKNPLRSRFCSECGARLDESRAPRDGHGRLKLHVDIAHPINSECRARIQDAILAAYQEECDRARSPDYVPPSDVTHPAETPREQAPEATPAPQAEEAPSPPEEAPSPPEEPEEPPEKPESSDGFGAGLL